MSNTTLGQLLESAAEHVQSHLEPNEAWWAGSGRRRRRRRRALVAACTGTAAAIVLVAVSANLSQSGQRPPTPLKPGTPDPTATTAGEPDTHLPIKIVKPDWQDLATAPSLGPPADAPALSEDPVSHAALVMGDPEDQAAAYVLGDDGEWRRLDVSGLTPVADGYDRMYTSSVVRPTGVDPGGTRLAIPQLPRRARRGRPDDRRVQGVRRAGANHELLWLDETHVVVWTETGETRHVVDLQSGAVAPTDLALGSRVLPDGNTLSWTRSALGDYTWNGTTLTSVTNNRGALQETAPLLRQGLGVVISGSGVLIGGADYPPEVMSRSTGVTAVDLASGDPVGFTQLASSGAPTQSVLLGWRGDLPLLGLVSPRLPSNRIFVAGWDIHAGTLDPIATVPFLSISPGESASDARTLRSCCAPLALPMLRSLPMGQGGAATW